MAKSPAVILFDSTGQAMAVEDGVAIPEGTHALLAAGSDGSDAKILLVDADGQQIMVGAGVAGTPSGGVLTVQGDPSGTPIPVTGSISLPGGAATEATLSSRLAESTFTGRVNTLGQKTMAGSTPVVLASDHGAVGVAVSNFPAVQPVSAAVLPLPAGAAQDATLTGGTQRAINRGGAKGSTTAADVTSTSSGANHQALDVVIYDVSGNPITSFGGTGSQGAPNTTANAWPTKVTDGTNTATVKGASSAAVAGDPALVVAVSPNNTVGVTGSVSVANFPATQPVSAASLPLPSGAATSALQGTGNTSLGSIDTKTPALVSGRVPVDGSAVTQPVSAASLPLPSGAATATLQGTGNTSLGSIDTKTPALVSGRVPVDGSAITQPVSAAALPLPSGAATAAKQPALGTAGTPSSDVLTVQGAASMTALRVDGSAVTQPVSGTVAVSNFPGTQAVSGSVSVSNFPATQPVSAASLPLPSGAATSALQTTGNTSLGNIDTKIPALVSGRMPVDGSAVTQPVSGTVTANIGTVGTLALNSTLTGGTQKSIVRGGAKGATAAADVTSLAAGANHQALAVAIVDALGNHVGSFAPVTSASSTTSVASSASSVQLLAANASRVGATVYNDSNAVLYVKLGTTASTSSFTVRVLANGYYEVPFGYNGRIDGIWASANGNARLTELS